MVKANPVTQDDDAAVERLNAGATWSDAPDDSDVSFPVLSLIQMTGKIAAEHNGKSGWYYLPGFAPFEHPVVVPFKFGKSRRYAVEDDMGRKTLCYAPVGSRFGIPLDPDLGPGGECASCPLAQWGDDQNGKRVPPACDEETRFLVVSADAMMPAQLIFRGMARQVGRQLAGILKARPGGLAIVLGSRKETNARNQVWYAPTFEVITRSSNPELVAVATDGIELARSLIALPDAAPF